MNQQLYDDIKYGTNIIPEDEYLETLTYISGVASEMVQKTLGPYGKTTMLNDGVHTYPTKDGWSVLKSLKWNDPVFNVLYSVLKEVSFDLVSKVGDGTTTAFVGATIFISELNKYMEEHKDYRQSDLLKDLTEAKNKIIERFSNSKYVKQIDPSEGFSEIYHIAEIASNGNKKLAEIIQNIYEDTNNPSIYVTIDPSEKLDYEIQKGYKLDCKVINQKIYINSDDGTYGESTPMNVFVFDHNVSFQNHQAVIAAIANYSNNTRSASIVIAPHFDDVMLNVIRSSMESLATQGQIPNLLLVQIPLSGSSLLKEYLNDVILLTNSTVFDYAKVSAFNALVHNTEHPDEKIEDSLLNTDQYKDKTPLEIIQMCMGKTRKIVAGRNYLLIQDYEGIVNKKLYDEAMKDVKEHYLAMKDKADKSTTPLHKEYMDAYQHYSKLTGNLGVIKVGGESELEKSFLKDSVDDAVLACRSAYDNGYVRGLNLAMLNVIDDISKEEGGSPIYSLLLNTFKKLSIKVLENKNPINGQFPISTLDGSKTNMTNQEIIDYAIAHECGYDLTKDQFIAEEECYVVNSVKTDIEVLKGMISVVSMVLTSNQFLSINRSYDRAMGQKQRSDMMIKQKSDEWTAAAKSIINVMREEGIII